MSESSHGSRRLVDLGRRLGPRGLLLLGCREDVLAVIAQHPVSRIRVFGRVDVSTPAVLKPHVRERALAEAVVL